MKKPNTELRIPAIETFLQGWKSLAFNWYRVQVEKGNALDAKARKFMADQIEADPTLSEYQVRRNAEYQKLRLEARDYWWYHAPKAIQFLSHSSDVYIREELNKLLDKELIAKRNTLIYRVVEKIGDIVDASVLEIGDNGEINGIITGTTGKARVETISAGGYNIQCFHFRVLVHVIK